MEYRGYTIKENDYKSITNSEVAIRLPYDFNTDRFVLTEGSIQAMQKQLERAKELDADKNFKDFKLVAELAPTDSLTKDHIDFHISYKRPETEMEAYDRIQDEKVEIDRVLDHKERYKEKFEKQMSDCIHFLEEHGFEVFKSND